MAVEAKYTRQAPMVLTDEQRWCLQATAEEDRVSMSGLVREAIDARYGLVDGRFPDGDPRVRKMAENPLPAPRKR